MTTKAKPRRRSPGEGGVFEYATKAGVTRFGIKFMLVMEDGTAKPVLRRKGPNGEIWTKKTEAQKAVREALNKVDKKEWIDPSKQPLGEWLDTWVEGHRKIVESTRASYKKNIRLHLKPYIGGVPLASLTSAKIDKLYRDLETGGRRNNKSELTGQGLSARTVRYVHTILRAALHAAVHAEPALLVKNPADKANPPTTEQTVAPEMHPWSPGQLRTFLDWSAGNSVYHTEWYLLAATGMRRGELLALRWRDIDLDKGTVQIRRSVGCIRVKGQAEQIKEGPTKNKKSRTVDIDPVTVALLRAHKRTRGGLALQLGRDDALVFGDREGNYKHPDRFRRRFKATLARCRDRLAENDIEAPSDIRLHDLRHTHATLQLSAGVNPKVVSERLGHQSIQITLQVYSHVLPTIQREAADKFAAIMAGNA